MCEYACFVSGTKIPVVRNCVRAGKLRVILKIADQSSAGSHFNSQNTHSQFRNSHFTCALIGRSAITCISRYGTLGVIFQVHIKLERLEVGTVHMCLTTVSGYRPLINPPVPRKSTFRYNSMFIFIPVSFTFLLFLGLWSVIGLGFRVSVRDR